jgi:hypothetical protein
MKLFEKNVGGMDKTARLVLGPLLIVAGYLLPADALVRGIIALLGLVLLFTGVMGTCLLYSLIGVNTAKKQG